MDGAPTARVLRMVARLELGGSASEALGRLCSACVAELDVSGASVALIIRDDHCGTIGASDDVSAGIEELQSTLGEGPGWDAHRWGGTTTEPHLASSRRWGAFAPAALALGAGAVFAFPLRLGSVRWGALVLYRRSTGRLEKEDRADGSAMAGVAATLLAQLELEASGRGLTTLVEELVDGRSVVHQAAGMVSVQLDVTVEDAHAALRARAFADERSLADLSADVVTRKQRLVP